ncbi:MAG: GTP-binding protein [Kofleriaceae bacterium]
MRVPLVLLTGFLGSGKTTLVNRLLARRGSREVTGKLGVIVNELGAVDIDGALLRGGETRQITLPGGCVCCVMGDDLDRTLLELCDANPDLEAIVLETTGVAEPLPIAWAVTRPPVSDRVRLAAVVTLVDTATFRATRSLAPVVEAQIAYADVLLLTKAELAGPAEVAAVEANIQTLVSRVLVRTDTTDGHAAWLEDLLVDPALEHVPTTPHIHDDSCRHLDNSVARSAHGIDSVWVPVPATVDLEELEDRLADLPANYMRIKGILHAVDGRSGPGTPHWVAVHRVGLRVSSEPVDPQEPQQGRLVALGPGVEVGPLVACVAVASP